MKQVTGIELSVTEQMQALKMFVHRFTKEHVPEWSKEPRPDGEACKVQFASDKEWLANTLFWVTNSGRLSRQHNFCQSTPTWPDNKTSKEKRT